MADIEIQHCNIRLARRGGWSWGPDHSLLLRKAVEMLPSLVADRLSTLWPDDADVTITAPLQLTVKVSLQDLVDALDTGFKHDMKSTVNPLTERLRESLQSKLGHCVGVNDADTEAPDSSETEFDSPVAVAIGAESPDHSQGRLLQSWQTDGTLQLRLQHWSSQLLKLWHDHVYAHPREAVVGAPVEQLQKQIAEEAVFHATRSPGDQSDPDYRLRLRILVAASLLQACRRTQLTIEQCAAIDCHMPLEMTQGIRRLEGSTNSAETIPQEIGLPSQQSKSEAHIKSFESFRQKEMTIPCALPFLILGPLARIGYLHSLAAAAEQGGITSQLSLFAAGLAIKVMPKAGHIALRSPEERQTIALFANLQEAPSAIDIGRCASCFDPSLAALDSVVSSELLAGHSIEKPLLLHGDPSGSEGQIPKQRWILIEPEGAFVIAIAESLHQLLALLEPLGASILVVSGSIATPGLLSTLDSRNVRFISHATPTRREPWRRIHHTRTVYWTNDYQTPHHLLWQQADKTSATAPLIESLLEELDVLRPATLPVNLRLENSLFLAASIALGAVAWDLWRDREHTDALLTIERFSDLSARVKVDDNQIEVILPLGGRSADLAVHRLLDDVPGTPWLGGRRVRFARG